MPAPTIEPMPRNAAPTTVMCFLLSVGAAGSAAMGAAASVTAVLRATVQASCRSASQARYARPSSTGDETRAHLAGARILNLMVQSHATVDRAFAALADPNRRAVLERLGAGSATISELAEPFGMSLTGMKKHIRLLEEANLVATEKVGRARRCTLVPSAFEGISTWLQRLDRFAEIVERTKGAR